MAGRILNRMDLRRQAELAEERGPRVPAQQADASRGLAPRRAGGLGQVRVCARWGVFDGAMKLVETFDYNQRPQAEQRITDLNAARKNGTMYFLQMIKEAMPVAGTADLD
jgi:hypothetical protein